MATAVDWCDKCAATVYAEDGVAGACACPEGQLKQLLAVVRGPQLPNTPKATVPQQKPTRSAAMDDAELASLFLRTEDQEPSTTSSTQLESLWNTVDDGEDPLAPTASEDAGGLEALWAGRVAAETGADLGGADLESLWWNEINSETGSTVAAAEEITFDRDLDSEFSRVERPSAATMRNARFRVDRPPPRVQVAQAGRFAVMAESETSLDRERARAAAMALRNPVPGVQNFREVRASREAASRPAPPARPQSAFERAREYGSRTTVYQRLMNDDE